MSKIAIGIDIGGTGIKGGLVDLVSGELLGDRVRFETPKGGHPKDIVRVTSELIDKLGAETDTPVGVAFPSSIHHGVTLLAANVSDKWIDFKAEEYFEDKLKRNITFVNDADAAGFAEVRYGAAKGQRGLVIMTTLGTGIGSALIFDGVLIPNAELGHLEIDGHDAEKRASSVVREKEGLSYEDWAKRLQRYYEHVEMLFTPELFIVGGGVSKSHEKFLPLLKLRTPIVPATLFNQAGILGAAALTQHN